MAEIASITLLPSKCHTGQQSLAAMQASLQTRMLSGRACSTSSAAHYDNRAACFLVVRADGEGIQTRTSSREGWAGDSCYIQRRPAYPRAKGTADVASLDTALTARQNGKPLRIYETTDYVAETLLPTVHGPYRVRAYRHSVRWDTGAQPRFVLLLCAFAEQL